MESRALVQIVEVIFPLLLGILWFVGWTAWKVGRMAHDIEKIKAYLGADEDSNQENMR